MTIDITESAELQESASTDDKVGTRYRVRIIESDVVGSSGFYPADVLRRDGPGIFTKGLPMYLNHQTPSEKSYRPFGAVQDYAGELASDAYFDKDGLYADIEVFEHHVPMIRGLRNKIGVSIRAKGMSKTKREIDGRIVPVFDSLTSAKSVDFVVKAGAGGKLVEMLESATENSEVPSEEQETESEEQMEEALKAIQDLTAALPAQITAAVEAAVAAKSAKSEEAEESASDVDPLDIAEALSASSLDSEGRTRVLSLHRASKKPLAELIAAEEAYVKNIATSAAKSEEEGIEESAGTETDAEESATVAPKLPTKWGKK